MNRLHVPPAEITGSEVVVRGDRLGYLRDVLRLRPGAPVEVFDGEGHVYASTVERYEDDGAVLALGPRQDRPFSGVRITLLQGLPKADKFELIVQKAVELGATGVVPVPTERSIVKLDQKKAAERVERWQKIADEASRQCMRADRLDVGDLLSWNALLQRPKSAQVKRLLLDEDEKQVRLRDVLTPEVQGYELLIGPEGGFTRDEVEAAKLAGFTPVTLGPRILRTETAGLGAIAVIQHVLGDFA